MFGSVILEVFIGLLFLYLLLSLIATTAQEAIASILKLRAGNLAKGLRLLLDDPDNKELADRLLAGIRRHPTLAQLSTGDATTRLMGFIDRGPSYVPKDSFAIALLDTIRRETANDPDTVAAISAEDLMAQANKIVSTLPDGQLKIRLTLLVGDIVSAERHVQRRAEQTQKAIEGYFDQTMDRIAGWYRRKAQALSIVIGLILAVVLNADTLTFAEHLWSNQTLRSEIGAAAEVFIEKGGCQSASEADSQSKQCRAERLLNQTAVFPIGWNNVPEDQTETPDAVFGTALLPGQRWHKAIIGWIITGLAISLGAGFWFDTLQRILNLRASGRKPTS